MSQLHSDPSSESLQRCSPSELFPHQDGQSNFARNVNGKRSRDYVEGQLETPRKLPRLNHDHRSDRELCQQISNPSISDTNPNQEQGFTTGPGHIVFINEQGKRCPAICFNRGLFNIFKQIAEFTREVREGDKAIQKAQLEFERIKFSTQSADLDEAKRAVSEAIKKQEDIEAGIPGLTEAQRQCDTLTKDNRWSKLKLDNSRAVSQMMIEQILDRENLLNIPPPKLQVRAEDTKIPPSKPQKPAEDTKNPSREPVPVSGNTVDNTQESNRLESGLASSPTRSRSRAGPEEQITPRQLALRELRFAAEELQYYKEELTFMQEEYAQAIAAERKQRREQYPDRPASTNQTDADLQILQRTQQATRDFIEAEEGFDRAEARAEALGLADILADPHACYYGEVYNEFQPVVEQIVEMSPANRARIEAWMASVPDVAAVVGIRTPGDDGGAVEVDDWDAKSVEVFESVSLVACDLSRKKIDKWQEIGACLRGGES